VFPEWEVVVVSHRVGDEDSLIDNIYHNSEHTPQQNDEGEATNSVEKLILESCELQNDQPLVSHGNVAKLVAVGDHQEHTINFVEIENHHANRTDNSHYEDFSTVSKKHDPGRYDPKHPWRNHQWPYDLEWNQEEWNFQELLWR
jgi:hypothetical protein